MLQQFANELAGYLLKRRIVKEEDYEIYTYGIEALLSTLVNTVLVLGIGLALGMFVDTLIFLSAFAILRVYCGGYHARSHWGCILTYTVLYGCSMLIIRFLPGSFVFAFALAIAGLSLLIIFLLAPLEHVNRPFVGQEYKVFRLVSRIIASIEFILVVIFLLLKHRQLLTSLAISLAMLCVVFVLVFGKIKQRGGEKG